MATPPPVELDMTAPLPPQLAPTSPHTTHLTLAEDTPSDAAWPLLAAHFTNVTHLHLDSGWDESLNDTAIPTHWPLRKLTLSSACGEVCRSPWIVGKDAHGHGGVAHLVLNYTAGLRFEGPTTRELVDADAGKSQTKLGESEIGITWVPGLVAEWMREKHGQKAADDDDVDDVDDEEESNLRTLELIHNDAHDTLLRLALARPRRLPLLETLSLVAPSRNDFALAGDALLECLLPQLERLRVLVLVLADVYPDRQRLPGLWRVFPPGLQVLRLRTSVALAGREEVVGEWVGAFGDPAFLPELRVLSCVWDMEDGEVWRREGRGGKGEDLEGEGEKGGKEEGEEEEKEDESADGEKERSETVNEVSVAPPSTAKPPPKVSDEVLARAKRACERLYRAAEARGVKVEPFEGAWTEDFTSLGRFTVDERWERL